MKTKDLCLAATLIASLTGGKLALVFLHNIEIVTLLFVVYALVFGWRRTMIVCLIFILIEGFIWGFGLWVPIYLIYWPLLVTVISLLPKFKFRVPVAIAVGILFTAFFGVLSTAIEICLLGGLNSNFGIYFYFRYISGVEFFITHIVSNSIILTLLVPVLYKTCSFYNKTNGKIKKNNI